MIENLRKQARRAGGPARARPVCCGGLPRSAAACSCARSAAITNGAAVSQSVRPSPSPPGVGGKVRRVAGHDPDRRRRRRRRPTRRLQAQHARQTRPPRGGHRRRLPSESGAWQRVGRAVGCICRQAAAGTPALRARIAPLRRPCAAASGGAARPVAEAHTASALPRTHGRAGGGNLPPAGP